MRNITTTYATPITRVRLASPKAADRGLTVGIGTSYTAPMLKAFAVKDVAHLRSGRPPV